MTLKEMIEKQFKLQNEIACIEASIQPRLEPIQVELQSIKEQINQKASEEAARAYQAAKKDTGTVDFIHEDVKVKAVVEKKVDWDQKKLAEIWAKIGASGDKPEQYITKKETFTVPERAFAAWPDQIKNVFMPARTLTPKPPKFEFVIIDLEETPF